VAPTNGQAPTRAHELARRLSDLVQREKSLIDEHRPGALVDRSGYHIHGIADNGQVDLARLLVGSEGTLALITEATVRTDPRPRLSRGGLAVLWTVGKCRAGALAVSEQGVSACDLMDRRLLTIARELDVRFDLLIPAMPRRCY